ncbi:MAG TPA: protein translocase subunit SecD [Abditibacteriaceae bacterium]|jgi:SecD/SecF fusion protein
MFRSRAVQYLGLVLLVLASLAVIFYPIGPRPEAQEYTLRFTAPRPFEEMARADKKNAGKSVSDIADAAFATGFPTDVRVPPQPLTVLPDGRTATLVDRAANRQEAQSRVQLISNTLGKLFPGTKTTAETQQAIADLPVKPLFALGNSAVYPPKRDTAIKLGLDLQGGVNLVLQVRRALFAYTFDKKLGNDADARDAFAAQVRAALRAGGSGLDEADVNLAPGASSNIVEVRTQARDREQFEAQKRAIVQVLNGIAGVKFTESRTQFYQAEDQNGQQTGASNTSPAMLNQTVEIVRARVDSLGVSEPLIQAQPPDRIIVQLPGIRDPESAIRTIGTTAQMQICLLPQDMVPVQDPADPNNTLFRDQSGRGNVVSGEEVLRRSEIIVRGTDVKPNTTTGFTEGGAPAVFFELQGRGSQRFADVTRQVAGKGRHIPIFLDQRCISAPTVESPITGGSGQISGGFKNIQEARDLALLLNSGALPAPIDVVENRTISATLGKDSLLKSLNAGLIGLAAVAVFMIVFYRLPGMLANVALVVYCVLNLAVFILLGGTLTLPGIAGFLLAIAMSLDTNILVFERLKEEMAIQPTFAAALRAAFSRAWTAILDSHVTTLIAAVVLFFFGTGPVKGFALTLAVGVLLSLFSAISVTRLFMWSVAGAGERNRSLFGTPVQRADGASTAVAASR